MKIKTIELTNDFKKFSRGDSEIIDSKDQNIKHENENDPDTPKALREGIIKSNIDGGTSYTNIQDKNTNDWSNFGSILGGSVTNALGVTNSDISDIGSIVKDIVTMVDPSKDSSSDFDKSMSKINEWKSKVYKDLHPFDWKPGQTIPQDLMDTSAGSLANDMIEMFGSQEFKNGYRKGKRYISPDPIKYVRDSMKSSKGINPNQEVFKVQSEEAELYKDTSAKNFSGYDRSPEETKFINALKNKNTFNKTLGYIYIKPKYNYGKEEMMQIPFEFNPEISGDGNQASYISETLLNRIGQFHVYTGTNLSQLSVSLKYIALSPDYTDEKDIAKQFSTDIWQYYWTNNRIESIEYQLRSLVFPDVTSANYLIRPPLIELHLGNEDGIENVGDLYKYPIQLNNGNDDSNYLSVTRSVNETVNRYKKYIVTNVQIDPINEDSYMWPSYYGRVWDNNSESGSPINHIQNAKDFAKENKLEDDRQNKSSFTGTRRTGFRATLQLLEVTENFLDIVPDFKAYYNAWTKKSDAANVSYDNAKYLLGGDDFIDTLNTELVTSAKSIEDDKNDLDNLFIKAYKIASLYKDKDIKNINDSAIGSKSEKDPYYYINKKWFYKDNKDIKEDEELNPNNDPIFFNVLLKGSFDRFIISDDTLPFALGEKQNVYDKKYTEDELIGDNGNGNPKEGSSISDKLSTEDFCIDENHLDYLGLFPTEKEPTGYDKKGKLSYIFREETNANKYTDAECFLILERMLDISNKIQKTLESNENANAKLDELMKQEKNKVAYVYLKYAESIKENSKITNNNKLNNSGIYDSFDGSIGINNDNIIVDKDLQEYLKYIYENVLEENIYSAFFLDSYDSKKAEKTNYLVNEMNFIRSCDEIFKTKLESTLIKGDMYDAKTILGLDLDKYIKNNICFDSFLNSLKNQSNQIEYFNDFNKYLSIIEKDVKNKYSDKEYKIKSFNDMKKYFQQAEERCNNCVKEINKSIDSLTNILFDCLYSYEKAMFDAGNYLSKSIICGDNIKCIRKKSKKIKLSFKYYSDDKNNFTSSIYKNTKEEEIYETYIKDEGITILNVRKIMDSMVEGFNKALKELEPINEKIKKTEVNLSNEESPDFSKIDFKKDNATYLGNQKDKEENLDKYIITFRDDLKINSDSIKKLLNYIIYLKESLSYINLEKSFHKVVGSPEKKNDEIQNAGIKGLDSLKNKYEDYSKNENALRKEVFEGWDKTQTFASADSLVNEGNFKEKFEISSNGEIPNKYCTILERETNMKSLKIASNNVKDYNRLNETSKNEV